MTILLPIIIAMTGVGYAIYRTKEIPESVSSIAYIMPHWAFSVWIALTGLSTLPFILEALPSGWQWVGFLCVVGLLIVASSSYYKTEKKTLHWIGGILCAVCALIVVAIVRPWLLLLWIPFFIALMKWPNDQWFFWVECAVFLQIWMSLIN